MSGHRDPSKKVSTDPAEDCHDVRYTVLGKMQKYNGRGSNLDVSIMQLGCSDTLTSLQSIVKLKTPNYALQIS